MMKTDIHENDSNYELAIDLPGFKKDEITASLDNGYLTVSAAKELDKRETTENSKLIRQERYAGSMKRSFYVGEDVTEEDVRAKLEDGLLTLDIPKKEPEKLIKQKKYIPIA